MEPFDAKSYDTWQDREGLADASAAVRVAWQKWEREWRKIRNKELAPVAPSPKPARWYDTLSKREQHGARRAKALGAQWAMCSAQEIKRPLTPAQRVAWFRWRKRVTQADYVVWQVLWPLVDGEPVEDVAARLGVEPIRLGRQAARACLWLLEELYPATIG